MSRIGKKAITVPAGVKVAVANGVVNVEGPKGKLSMKLRPEISAAFDATAKTVTGFATRLDKIYADARNGADMGMQDMNDAAKMMMIGIDPDIKTGLQRRLVGIGRRGHCLESTRSAIGQVQSLCVHALSPGSATGP